uniref:Uncharacterized protein n=2 Tax=Klebsiella/Raoultella group TaxID=2890311 RepID=A0A6G6APM2_KLEPN|nr:hypothetical protein [Klebsiella pneumoniae]QNL32599.1 Hypothetical protein [Raoultella ornithinolytica]UFD96704.1 hypothetical protein [Klebsiella oxytoca]UFD96977.1 hypothetical protein [Klebsiella pneumoniae]
MSFNSTGFITSILTVFLFKARNNNKKPEMPDLPVCWHSFIVFESIECFKPAPERRC